MCRSTLSRLDWYSNGMRNPSTSVPSGPRQRKSALGSAFSWAIGRRKQ